VFHRREGFSVRRRAITLRVTRVLDPSFQAQSHSCFLFDYFSLFYTFPKLCGNPDVAPAWTKRSGHELLKNCQKILCTSLNLKEDIPSLTCFFVLLSCSATLKMLEKIFAFFFSSLVVA
jgi:hypothetical protein